MKKKRVILYNLLFFCVVGAVFTGWNLYRELKPRIRAEQTYERVRTLAFAEEVKKVNQDAVGSSPVIRPDFSALRAWNPDIIGWIQSPGTDIDYPVVQGGDNEYYLNRTADKQISVIGSIFMEAKNRSDFGDDVTVLYGHHVKNGRMFSSLSGYKNQSYYEEHPQMILFTPEKDYYVELFAGRVIGGQSDSFPLIFCDLNERLLWLDEIMATTTFRSFVAAAETDRILALCTCSYEYKDARYVVFGVLKDMEGEHEKN